MYKWKSFIKGSTLTFLTFCKDLTLFEKRNITTPLLYMFWLQGDVGQPGPPGNDTRQQIKPPSVICNFISFLCNGAIKDVCFIKELFFCVFLFVQGTTWRERTKRTSRRSGMWPSANIRSWFHMHNSADLLPGLFQDIITGEPGIPGPPGPRVSTVAFSNSWGLHCMRLL